MGTGRPKKRRTGKRKRGPTIVVHSAMDGFNLQYLPQQGFWEARFISLGGGGLDPRRRAVGGTAREAADALMAQEGRKLEPWNYIDREAYETGRQFAMPPAVMYAGQRMGQNPVRPEMYEEWDRVNYAQRMAERSGDYAAVERAKAEVRRVYGEMQEQRMSRNSPQRLFIHRRSWGPYWGVSLDPEGRLPHPASRNYKTKAEAAAHIAAHMHSQWKKLKRRGVLKNSSDSEWTEIGRYDMGWRAFNEMTARQMQSAANIAGRIETMPSRSRPGRISYVVSLKADDGPKQSLDFLESQYVGPEYEPKNPFQNPRRRTSRRVKRTSRRAA
jgi:hypothetical protein